MTKRRAGMKGKDNMWKIDFMSRLENIDGQNKEQHNRIITAVGKVETSVDKVLETINGNGKPGMKQDMATIKAELGVLKYAFAGCVAGIIIPVILKYVFKIG